MSDEFVSIGKYADAVMAPLIKKLTQETINQLIYGNEMIDAVPFEGLQVRVIDEPFPDYSDLIEDAIRRHGA